MKLGKKINLVIMAVVITTLAVGFWVIIRIEGQSIEKQVRMDVRTVSDLVRKDVERMFTQITTQKESLQEVIDALTKRIPGIKYIEIVDTKGNNVATTREERTASSEVSKLAIVKEILEKKVPIFEQKTEGNQYSLEYHAPIFDSKKEIINVIETELVLRSKSAQDVADAKRSLDLTSASVEQGTRSINIAIKDGNRYIQSIVDDASQLGKLDKTSESGFFHDIAIFDINLNVLASTGDDPNEFINAQPYDAQNRHDVATGVKEIVEYEEEHEGEPVIVHVEPIKIHDMKGEANTATGVHVHDMSIMSIVGVMETHTLKSAYLNRINELRIRMLGVGIIFTATIIIVLAVILEREVVGPIRRYSIIARKVADGDLSQKVEHISNDEIGQFGDVFNSMVANLRELDRLKSDFISIAAHQLRTPLSGVKWVLKLILDGDLGAVNDDQKGMLKRGYETNEKMIQLVNDLLNVSRIENGKFGYNLEKNDFIKLIQILTENVVLSSRERNIEVVFENRVGDVLEFLFDPEKLLIALQNLVDNAVKYTLPGGRVTIVIERQGDYVQLKVSDTGVGIPKADLPKLFSKFFRAANVIHLQTDGSGLGLFIVKNIILRHGGQIWVDSVEGKGTTFTIVIPVISGLLPKNTENDARPIEGGVTGNAGEAGRIG